MVYNSFDKKSTGSCIKNEVKKKEQLPKELQKPITKKFE